MRDRRSVVDSAVRRVPGSARARAVILCCVLLVLEVGVFGLYFVGLHIPPWDFTGSYATDAYYWWENGSFFSPVEWAPSNWGGYPTAAILQNSAWYLPAGLASLFGPLTLHSIAVLQALHVGLGYFGAFTLLRRLGQRYVVALFAAVAWFFAVGFFSNSEHVDIVRGYAWLPWVILVLTPRWPWNRWWSVPVATLVLWQAATGVYPGMLVATVYVAVFWTVASFVLLRPRSWVSVASLSVSGVAAGLLSMPRLWPYLQYGSTGAASLPDTSVFSWTQVGTLVFGYGSSGLPGDVSMRSFFIPATVLVLAAYARWRDPIAKLGVVVIAPAFVLGMPFLPWFTVSQSLPGLGLSRFTMSDFKVFLVLGVLLLGCSGLTWLLGTAHKSGVRVAALAVSGGLLVVMVAAAVLGPYSLVDWAPGLVLLAAVTAGCAAWPAVAPRWAEAPQGTTGLLAVGVLLATVVSGVGWAAQSHETWLASRSGSETYTFGARIDDILASREDARPPAQRPARTPLPLPVTEEDLSSKRWNGAVYSGGEAVGGYVNLKGLPTAEALSAALLSPEDGPAVAAFLAAPGTLLSDVPEPGALADALDRCVDEGDCGPVTITPVSYLPPTFAYRLSVTEATTGLFNEPYYEGRSVRACTGDGACTAVSVSMDPTGLMRVDLPAGDYTLWADYTTPGRTVGWVAFWVGVAVVVASGTVHVVLGLRRREKHR